MKSVLAFMALMLLVGTLYMPRPAHAVTDDTPLPPAPPAKVEGGDKPKEAKGGEGGEDGAKPKKPEDVSGGRFAGDPIFVHIAPMVMPIITENGVEQLITLQIDVQVTDFDSADSIHTNMPRVRDALMRALYGGLGTGNLRNGKLVDVTKIKAKALPAIESVTGPDSIRDVLIQGVSQRML